MSYSLLSDALYDRLSPLVTDGSVKVVTQYEVQNQEGYPYISIVEDDTPDDEQVFDTISDLASYGFKVRIVHNSRNLSETNEQMRSLTDLVLEKLREDLTFGCIAVKSSLSVKWGYLNEEQTRVCEISLKSSIVVGIG